MAHNVKPGCVSDAASDREDEDDGFDEITKTPVPCSYPGCTCTTYLDPIYGDLCSMHIRAKNE